MVDGNRQMQARLFVGVDGGGSRTRARVRADSGELLGEAEAEAGNARLPQGYEENIRACRLAIAAAGLGEDAMARVYAGFGLAGTQQDTDLKNILDRSPPALPVFWSCRAQSRLPPRSFTAVGTMYNLA